VFLLLLKLLILDHLVLLLLHLVERLAVEDLLDLGGSLLLLLLALLVAAGDVPLQLLYLQLPLLSLLGLALLLVALGFFL